MKLWFHSDCLIFLFLYCYIYLALKTTTLCFWENFEPCYCNLIYYFIGQSNIFSNGHLHFKDHYKFFIILHIYLYFVFILGKLKKKVVLVQTFYLKAKTLIYTKVWLTCKTCQRQLGKRFNFYDEKLFLEMTVT